MGSGCQGLVQVATLAASKSLLISKHRRGRIAKLSAMQLRLNDCQFHCSGPLSVRFSVMENNVFQFILNASSSCFQSVS